MEFACFFFFGFFVVVVVFLFFFCFFFQLNGEIFAHDIYFYKTSSAQRTTCIKAQKWPPTKLTHIVMNNSCVVPLTETGMEIGDKHNIWGQIGVKGYDS